MNEKRPKVQANQKGELITLSPRNPLWGWIRVVQTRHVFDEETGIVNTRFCSALLQGKVTDLEKLGLEDDMELDGKIIFKDTLTPYRSNSPEKDYKIAGKSGVVCSIDGQPIYRKYFYSPNPNAVDVFLQHDEACKKEIREAHEVLEKELEDGQGDFAL